MDIGFIGLGHMGFPMARRLLEAGHTVIVHDTQHDAQQRLVALGAEPGTSPRWIADRVATVFTSLPSPQVCLQVATGADGLVHGSAISTMVDLSTAGQQAARRIHAALAERRISLIDSPVSGGVAGAEKGTLAVMVSGPHDRVQAVLPALQVLGKPFYLGEAPGAAQTMKLVNNMLSATALAATAEALALGVKSGLDPQAMIEVVNAGSGANTASLDKFPRAVLTGTFDYGFATGLMVKDLRLCLAEAHALDLTLSVSESVEQQWECTLDSQGAESDFTCVARPIEEAAGVQIRSPQPPR